MTVTGGAGCGKTTAITQAIAAEADHVDVWYPCSHRDRSQGRLLDGLVDACAAALGVPRRSDHELDVDALAELVLDASPRQVCLLVDDAHLLNGTNDIEELLSSLPTNGHVMLAGRSLPKVRTARLDAARSFDAITQSDLLMTADEVIEFANLRSVDVRQLEGAEGWPAFVELAAVGKETGSRRYLEEEAVRGLAPERRRALAAFSLVGGGNDDVARACAGTPLADLIEGLPLVRWSDDEARLHDIWNELLVDELTAVERERAASAVSKIYRSRGAFDRAVELAVLVEDWADVAHTIGEAVRQGVDGGLRSELLQRWRLILPSEVADSPVGVLVQGLLERERDPTTDRAAELLDRAALGFADANEPALEIVALMQLGYVARISGEPERISQVMSRVETLAADHLPAAPFLAFFEAWTGLATGRPEQQLAALESIIDADIPTAWQVSRDHLIANALVNLGRPIEALNFVPVGIDSMAVPIPGPLVTESQCLWFSGQPERALTNLPSGLSHRYGARDKFIAGVWIGTMQAYTGDLEAARESLRLAREHIGEQPGVLVGAQLFAVELLIKLAQGDETEAMAGLEEILAFAPLGDGVSEQLLRGFLSIPYVGVPSTRDYWETVDLGPTPRTALEIARAFVQARDEHDLRLIAAVKWPEPGALASMLPVRWAMEFALYGVTADRHEGRLLAAWLCEHWGSGARSALHSWVDDPFLRDAARDVLSHTPSPPDQQLSLRLLGQVSLTVNGYESPNPDWRRERVRALLVLLALRPVTTRDALAGLLWPDLTMQKALKNLRTTLNYLHTILEPRRLAGDATWYVRVDGQQVRLQPQMDLDLWDFRQLLDEADDAERRGRPNLALPLLIRGAKLWRGDLAEDLDYEWLDLERIHLRSRFVRASCRAAELLIASNRATDAIEIMQPALGTDPWHERGYVALAGAYEALGDYTSAHAVLALGTEQLGATPTRQTQR